MRTGIQVKFGFVVNQLQIAGPLVGTGHARRVTGYDNLWEVRVKEGTILQRFFFGFGPNGLIAVACVVPKTSRRLGPRALKNAELKVAQFLAVLDDRERRSR